MGRDYYNVKDGVLLIGLNKGYIFTSIRDKLLEEIENVYEASSLEDIESHDGKYGAMILYCDEQMVRDTQLLVFIKDKATEDNLPIFVIGNDTDLDDAQLIIPERMIQTRFTRPVNVKDVVRVITQYVSEHDHTQMKKILAVDDSEMALHSIKSWLEDSYQVMLADSGVNAIKVIALNKPDLILLDYEMPVCDGRLTLEMIRSEREFADIPVVFLTGKSDRESILRVMELKPVGYLLKTAKPSEVKKFVDDFFTRQRLAALKN